MFIMRQNTLVRIADDTFITDATVFFNDKRRSWKRCENMGSEARYRQRQRNKSQTSMSKIDVMNPVGKE